MLDYISLNGNKLTRFVNNEVWVKIKDVVDKLCKFFVVHSCGKCLDEAHEISCIRI